MDTRTVMWIDNFGKQRLFHFILRCLNLTDPYFNITKNFTQVTYFGISEMASNLSQWVSVFSAIIWRDRTKWSPRSFFRANILCDKDTVVSRSVMSDSLTPWTIARQVPIVCEILQARILEWVAIPFSRGYSRPRDWTQVPCIAGRFFTTWGTMISY